MALSARALQILGCINDGGAIMGNRLPTCFHFKVINRFAIYPLVKQGYVRKPVLFKELHLTKKGQNVVTRTRAA